MLIGTAIARDVVEPPASQYPADRYAKVAVLQWTHPAYAPVPATPDRAEAYKARNRAELADWAERAREAGAELIATPEFGVTGYPRTDDGEDQFSSPAEISPYAESIPGPSTRYFGALSKKLGMYIEFDLAERGSDGAYYNAAVVVDPGGRIAGSYRKRNLFGGERDFLSPGSGTTIFETPFGRIGLMICADVYHRLTVDDYRAAAPDAILVSAAWTVANSAMNSFRALARQTRMTVVASNLADFPDSGVVNPDGSDQSHIRNLRGLAFGYLKRK